MASRLELTEAELKGKLHDLVASAKERISALRDELDGASRERDALAGELSFANEGIAESRYEVSLLTSQREESDLKLMELSGQLRELIDPSSRRSRPLPLHVEK